MLWAIVALCAFGSTSAQVISLGRCPVVETTKDFNVTNYLGRWYEAQRYFMAAEVGTRCVVATYKSGENDTIDMTNSYTDVLGNQKSINAVARIPDENDAARMKVKYPDVPSSPEGDYWVLGTDYDNYAVVYSCQNQIFTCTKRAWILTRARNAGDDIINKAIDVAVKNQLRKLLFAKTEQTDC